MLTVASPQRQPATATSTLFCHWASRPSLELDLSIPYRLLYYLSMFVDQLATNNLRSVHMLKIDHKPTVVYQWTTNLVPYSLCQAIRLLDMTLTIRLLRVITSCFGISLGFSPILHAASARTNSPDKAPRFLRLKKTSSTVEPGFMMRTSRNFCCEDLSLFGTE